MVKKTWFPVNFPKQTNPLNHAFPIYGSMDQQAPPARRASPPRALRLRAVGAQEEGYNLRRKAVGKIDSHVI